MNKKEWRRKKGCNMCVPLCYLCNLIRKGEKWRILLIWSNETCLIWKSKKKGSKGWNLNKDRKHVHNT